MTILQIVLLAVAGGFAVASIVFNVMFIVEISKKEEEQEEIESVFTVNVINENNKSEETEEDVDAMLAKLDEETAGEETETVNESEEDNDLTNVFVSNTDEVEETEEEAVEEVENLVVENAEEIAEVQETEEEAVEAESEEIKEVAEPVETEEESVKKEEKAEEVQEETVEAEEKAEEVQEETAVETEEKTEDDEDDDDDADATEDAEILEYTGLKEEPIEYSANGSIDYASRLEKITATRDKIDRDLAKVQKAILKYERTKRRKNRNQKMLDRRAGELTNLNLVMYSVTDIKNVDEDKKVKQEELTAHIAELKASIQDAEEYIESNKEKNEHNVKMAKFLAQEKSRYNEEIAEIESIINSGDADNK